MNRSPLLLLLSTLGPAVLGSAHAADTTFFNVATGSPTGTYSAMFRNIGQVCTQSAYLKERGTGGSLDNIDLLMNNEVSLAFVQSDVLKARQQIDQDPRVANIKALLPLYDEEIHLFAKPPVTSKSFLGKTTVTGVQTFHDLKDKRVAAWGGSVVTAKVLSAKLAVPYSIVPAKDQPAAFTALNAGQVDAVLAVIGQPAAWVKGLSGVRLVPVPFSPPLEGIYTGAKLLYPNLSVSGVPTVAVQSVLVTRDFKTPDKKERLLAYKKCAVGKLVNLQEDEGMHPKWQQVTFKTWPWPEYR